MEYTINFSKLSIKKLITLTKAIDTVRGFQEDELSKLAMAIRQEIQSRPSEPFGD